MTVEENGTYTYSFTDSAGNTANVTVTVTDVDNTPPVLSFSLTSGGEGYPSWDALAEANDVSNIDSVYLKSNENGNYTFQNTSGTINADTWVQLNIEKTGIYPLTDDRRSG